MEELIEADRLPLRLSGKKLVILHSKKLYQSILEWI